MMVQLADVLTTLALLIAIGSFIYFWIVDKRKKEEIDNLKEEARFFEVEAIKYKQQAKSKGKLLRNTNLLSKQEVIKLLIEFEQDFFNKDKNSPDYIQEEAIKEWLDEELHSNPYRE